MKISKLFAGMSAIALAATMAISASAESVVYENTTDYTPEAWKNAFPGAENGDDYLDARTFTRDQDLKVTVDFKWGIVAETQGYINIGPGYANGWKKFGEDLSEIKVDFPMANALPDGYSMDGEDVLDENGDKCPVFLKKDGFININDTSITSVTFTIPAKTVNKLIDDATKDEDSFNGVILQVSGGYSVEKVTCSQDGVTLASVYDANKDKNGDSNSDNKSDDNKSDGDSDGNDDVTTDDNNDGDGKSDDNTGNTGSGSGDKSNGGSGDSSSADNSNAATGATAGIALAGVALAGAAVIATKKRK